MKKWIFWLPFYVGLSGCQTTTNITLPVNKDIEPSNSLDYNIFASQGGSSVLIERLPQHFCGLDLTVQINKAYVIDTSDPIVTVSFFKTGTAKALTIFLYVDTNKNKVLTAFGVNDEDGMESLLKEFDLGQRIGVMIARDGKKLEVAMDAATKMENILNVVRKSSNSTEGYSEQFTFQELDMGFVPDEVNISGAAVDAKVRNITFDKCKK